MELMEDVIRFAALAGRYRLAASEDPATAPGWTRMADKYSAHAAALALLVATPGNMMEPADHEG
jgi:hypothetical protein